MKVLFAVSNENISESIIKKYQSMYKEIISGKNVYYFNAILKELQKDKSYDRIVISEDLEPFANKNYETIDNFIFEKLDSISDEAVNAAGEDIPIILIATDRRTQGENILSKLFGIGVYSTLIGQDRSIQEVSKLINKPRSKKEAKVYYRIDSNEIDYKSESEENVSEVEIQNILTHYKRLGKNEEKYVESFNSIANQYTDEQLKVIVKFLPLGVKAVLESSCPKYQQIAAFAGESTHLKKQPSYGSTQINPKTKQPRSTDNAIIDNGIKIESIGEKNKTKMAKPVIIPATLSTKAIKKVQTPSNETKKTDMEENMNEEIKPIKKGRGRPKKVVTQEVNMVEKPQEIEQPNIDEEAPKKRRGRPKKVVPQETSTNESLNIENNREEDDELLPGLNNSDDMLPGFDTEDNENTLPGFDDEQDNSRDEGMFFDFEEPTLPGFTKNSQENTKNEQTFNNTQSMNKFQNEQEENDEEDRITNYNSNENNSNVVDNLITSNQKIVSFVGTSKNGTSFLVNNIADMLSNQGIKIAILDLTKNRNSYYIYTKNEEELRKTAIECTKKLLNGVAQGIQVNKNLDVYTSLPGENDGIEEYQKILSTLVQNYTLVLLDCDFTTNYGYLKESQEIYLVQSMDVLTIQPLTAYLRDLKAKNILDQNKLRIVINKYTRVRSVTEKTIIAGMAFYNDPSMSFMTELFNRENVKYTVIPFEMQTYSKYLEGLINCNITTNGYSKDFMNNLKRLTNMVYPLVTNTQNKYTNSKYNKYAATSNFSNEMNSTLNRMKRGF